jgi:hypothetical protein
MRIIEAKPPTKNPVKGSLIACKMPPRPLSQNAQSAIRFICSFVCCLSNFVYFYKPITVT